MPTLSPAGVFNVVTGNGAFGQSLATHPDVDKVSFTGSTEVMERGGGHYYAVYFQLLNVFFLLNEWKELSISILDFCVLIYCTV